MTKWRQLTAVAYWLRRTMATLVLENVSTARRGTGAVLDGVSLTLTGGEVTGLAGVSGNGQAALAAVLAGTEKPVFSSTAPLATALHSLGGSPRATIRSPSLNRLT